MTGKPTIVLVHGMWHGGWAWDQLVPLLEDHPTVQVTLPGKDRAPGDVTFRGHCDHLARTLAEIPGDVVLVGHSYGGAVLTQAGAAPNVRGMIFVGAFALLPGESVASINDAEAGSEAGADDIVSDGEYLVIAPETARNAFYHDCSEDPADRLTPEHASVRNTEVTQAAWQTVPSHFVVCTLDRACTPDVQRKMAARLDSQSELKSSHSPMLSMPDALARTILEFV
ncbi:alpha/beta fold hydrolase [Amycolatopsis jejuensis]|uniref:alpha/beta fold hydrolase n=1 Tax=Amycolatopsis jejuensis TaxID=330084 RepID=UPI00068F7A6F|nr:alpha/beta hydrolase [Amycolatopsis jejuensis]